MVATHSGSRAGQDALIDPAHEIAALGLTAPGLLLSLAGIIVLTIVVIASGRRSAQHGQVHEHGVRADVVSRRT